MMSIIQTFLRTALCVCCLSICCQGCRIVEPVVDVAAREARLLALLEVRMETTNDTLDCLARYALDSTTRYVYKRLPDDPPGTPRVEYDAPMGVLNTMSTRSLLETGLGHPNNSLITPLPVCSSIWRCRESIFELRNVWRVFEARPDALEECLRRYDQLTIPCEPLIRTINRKLRPTGNSFYEMMQVTLIEMVLTRPRFLEQLSPKLQRALAAKVVSKLRQADLVYDSELGKTQGLWLLGALVLYAKDAAFTEETRTNRVVGLLAQGLVLGHTLEMKAIILHHAERFAAGQ
jgi:hypothetical protein